MNISEWYKLEQARLAKFYISWMKMNEADPNHWPLGMEPGDWDEQFQMYDDAD